MLITLIKTVNVCFFVIPRTLLNIRLSYYFTIFRNEDTFKSIKHLPRSGYFVLLLKRNNDNNRRITFLRLVNTGVKVSRVVSRFAFIGHCIDRSCWRRVGDLRLIRICIPSWQAIKTHVCSIHSLNWKAMFITIIAHTHSYDDSHRPNAAKKAACNIFVNAFSKNCTDNNLFEFSVLLKI